MLIIYGGSFNPVTKAHLQICDAIHEKYPNAEIVLMPVGDVYPKSKLVESRHRLEMLRIATKGKRLVSISDFEIKNKTMNGTYETLNYFQNVLGEEVWFCMGADNLYNFEKWINYQNLRKEFGFLIIERDGFDVQELADEKLIKYEIIEFDSEISASAFKKDIVKNKEYVPEEVYEYIKKEGLYE